MQALLREYNGEQLVYVNVTYKHGNFYTPEGSCLSRWQILDISRDNRKNYVVCSYCGEMVKNTEEALEEHRQKMANAKNCLKCKKLREGYSKQLGKKNYVPDPNNPGQYIVTYKYSTTLMCDNNYWDYEIGTEEANRHCIYNQCKSASYDPICDIFTNYPHLFDTLPTVDILKKKKWKVLHSNNNMDYVGFTHPYMSSLNAYVNKKGIVDFFEITGRDGLHWYVMYSHRYDKLLFYRGDGYREARPVSLTEGKYNSALKHIKELFEEVK